MPTVTLIGFRGTGKTTVARLLGQRLGVPWWDADVELEARIGRSIADLVATCGEASFRAEESVQLAALLDRGPGIVATGGGVILSPDNRALIGRLGGAVVWLTASPEVIRRRLAVDPQTVRRRPALLGDDPLAEIDTLLLAREPLYRACADLVVDTGMLPPEDVAATIATRLPGGTAARVQP